MPKPVLIFFNSLEDRRHPFKAGLADSCHRKPGSMTFATNVFRYLAASSVHKGFGFVVLLWLAAHFSTSDYALVGLLLAIQTGVAAFAGSGVIEALLGELRLDPARRARSFQAALKVFALLIVVSLLLVGVAIPFISAFLNVSALDVLIVALSGILTAFFLVQSQLARLEERHSVSTWLSAVPPLLGLIIGLGLVFVVGTVSAFFVGIFLGLAASLLIFRGKYLGLGQSVSVNLEARIMARRSVPFIAIAILSWLTGYGANYIINPVFSDVESSRFTFAYTLSSGMQLLATSANQVWNPRFFKLIHEQTLAELERASARYFVWLGLLLGVAGAGLLVAAALLQHAFPSLAQYRNLSTELFFLLSVYALSIPWYHAQNYYFSHAEGARLLRLIIYSNLLSMAAWGPLIWWFGLFGMYAGFPLQMMMRIIFVCGWSAKKWRIGFQWQGTALAICFLLAGLGLSKWFDS